MLCWMMPERPLGTACCGEASSSRWWGAYCNGRRAKGSGCPSTPHRVQTASAVPRVAPHGAAIGTLGDPTGPDHKTPPPGPEAPGATEPPARGRRQALGSSVQLG